MPDDLIEALERYESELGVNHVAFRLQWAGERQATEQDKVLNAIRLIGEHVVPHFAMKALVRWARDVERIPPTQC